ncbi:hypothetical protein DSO57_1015383 [Entomophthora muscae]|uniref:Uncharacterized protein n=2 Tax=Entomophthora muscae TaxID=34485 RepID=A0ACC2RWE6_9FUNG|nr:hypothetical protein DSO57_1015383 [Entomophthora muscae]
MYRNSYHERSNSYSLGYSVPAPSNLSRFGSSSSVFNDHNSDSKSNSFSSQSMGKAPNVLPKRPSSLHCQSEDSLLFKKNHLKFHHDTTYIYSSPGRSVSRSPSLHEEDQVFLPKDSTDLNLPTSSPRILAQTTSQDSIQEMHLENEKVKNYYEVQLKGLVEDYSKAEMQVESLKARLIQEENQCQVLQSENEAYTKKARLKDEEIENINKQLESMVSAVAELQNEKADLLRELKDRDAREKEDKAVYDSQINAFQSKVEKMEALHDSLQKDIDSLHLEQQAWNKEKSHLMNQNNELIQTISNAQKQVNELERAQQQLQEQASSLDKLQSSGNLEDKICQITKEYNSAEAENHVLIDRLADISSPREKARSLNGAKGVAMDCSESIDSNLSQLGSQHSELMQKRRVLTNQIQMLEANVNKMTGTYNQVLAQSKVLQPKLHKQQEVVNKLQEEIQQLLCSKSELSKKKRELKMEVGSLESSISKSFKAIRRRVPLSNMSTCPNSPADSRSSSYSASALSSPSIKAKDTPLYSENAGLSDILSSLMPSLTFLESKDSINLEAQCDSARKRVDELKVMVDALHKAIELLHQQIDGHNSLYPDNMQGLVLQEVDASVDKLEDLCRLLTASTSDFSNLIQVEKQYYALQVENEALLMEVEKLKNNLHHAPEVEQLREQLTKLSIDKDAQLTQLKKEAEIQIQQLVQGKEILLEKLASHSSTYASQLDQHNSDKVSALERELAQARESEYEISQHFRALEEKHNQLIFDYGNVTQSVYFYSQELDDYKSRLEYSQDELFNIQTEVGNYQCEISHLEEQLYKLGGGYSSPASSTLVSPVLHSRRLSDIHYPEDLLNILEKIGDLHNRQLANIRNLLDGSIHREFGFIIDLQLELKELDLQAALALARKSSRRTLSMHESKGQFPKFIYSKPYKEMYHKSRSEAEDLRFLLDREFSIRSGLVFQKQFLLSLMRSDQASQDDTFSFVSSMCFLPQVPPFPYIPHLLQSLEFNSISNYSLATLPARRKLRQCVWAIIAIFRAKTLSSEWVHASLRNNHQFTVLTSPFSLNSFC